MRVSVRESFLKNVVNISSKADLNRFLTRWKEKENTILDYWQENSNLRMGEVLIGVKIIPPFSGTWMNTEDEVFLKNFGFADERTTTIITRYCEDGTEVGIPLMNTSERHLHTILKEKGEDAPAFIEKELAYRKLKKLSVVEVGNTYYKLEETDED